MHRLRDRVDAILVGANTVLKDDPQLTTRLPDEGGRDAVRVVVDTHLSLPRSRKLFTQRSTARTIVATVEPAESKKARALEALGVEVWSLPARKGRVDLRALGKRLVKAGLHHLLVEGGAGIYGELLREGLVDELWLFLAPKLVGGDGLGWTTALGVKQIARALPMGELEVERVGPDLLVRALLPPEATANFRTRATIRAECRPGNRACPRRGTAARARRCAGAARAPRPRAAGAR